MFALLTHGFRVSVDLRFILQYKMVPGVKNSDKTPRRKMSTVSEFWISATILGLTMYLMQIQPKVSSTICEGADTFIYDTNKGTLS